MSTEPMHVDVLFVEDDEALRETLSWHIEQLGWRVRGVGDGASALAECTRSVPDLVVLDVMLPGESGIEVCRALRERYDPSPGVLMLTARAEEADAVTCLDAGADDYVMKPCRPAELLARLRALARRVGRVSAAVIERGSVRIDPHARSVLVEGRALTLTATEFALLATLAREPSRVFSRAELLELVWHTEHQGYARNVDCHVTRLRRKLKQGGLAQPPIAAVYGMGYRYDA